MPSADGHPQIISDYLQKEISKGRMLGPFPPDFSVPELQVNRFGVIPKGHNTGKWRLITDLSFPPDHSVNDCIDRDLCSLSYITVDMVAGVVTALGRGSLLAKVDVEAAYRLIPVHPHDRPLQAVMWQNQIYVDPMLPFGLRSAPKIFNAVADAFQWHLQNQGIEQILHYLDDYITIGPPGSTTCQRNLTTLLESASTLGIPIAEQKTVGPTTKLTFLGIEINTVSGELLLPDEKRQNLKSMLHQWGDRKACTRKELESLVGHLNHACKVVRAGRSFLRRIIDLLHSRPESRSHSSAFIRLNRGFRADIAWWQTFIDQWNGISFLWTPDSLATICATSDASGRWGCGAWYGKEWFQLQWGPNTCDLPIAVKELLPIVIGCAIWGHNWGNHRIVWRCDNQVVVGCLKTRTSKNQSLMHLIRNLVFIEARLGFHLHVEYIDTHSNHLADDLSRDRLFSFLSKVPQASPTPTRIPLPLVDLLLDQQADWISPLWRPLFNTTLNMAWHSPHRDPTMQQRNDSMTFAPGSTSQNHFPSQR